MPRGNWFTFELSGKEAFYWIANLFYSVKWGRLVEFNMEHPLDEITLNLPLLSMPHDQHGFLVINGTTYSKYFPELNYIWYETLGV